MLASKGSIAIFCSNCLVASITAIAFILLFWPGLTLLWRKLRPGALGVAASSTEF
jgi:hypothetical protein